MTISTESPPDLRSAIVHQALTASRIAEALERMAAELAGKNAAIDQMAREREQRDQAHADELRERDEQVSALQARNVNLERRLAELMTIVRAPLPQVDSEGGTPE